MMENRLRKQGFTLVEVLMSVGVLAIGMSFVAAIFPTSMVLSQRNYDKRVANAAADEAFAKIEMYVDSNTVYLGPTSGVFMKFDPKNLAIDPVDWNTYSFDYSYPSDGSATDEKVYCWDAIWRDKSSAGGQHVVEVVVFVNRRLRQGTTYYKYNIDHSSGTKMIFTDSFWPGVVPISVDVTVVPGFLPVLAYREEALPGVLDLPASETFDAIRQGSVLIDGRTGFLYRVAVKGATTIDVDREWFSYDGVMGVGSDDFVWFVPGLVSGGRGSEIEVYRKIMVFGD